MRFLSPGIFHRDAKWTWLLPVSLWFLVWLGIQGGEPKKLLDPGSIQSFLHVLRGLLPLLAGGLGLGIALWHLRRRRVEKAYLLNPLVLVAIYGLTGILVSANSPEWPNALYLSLLYISAPVVLWTIVAPNNDANLLLRLMNLNWLFIVLLVALLFVLALFTLGLGEVILSPSKWLDCELQKAWFGITQHKFDSLPAFINSLPIADGLLRPTGVGRYAAIGGLVALAGLGLSRDQGRQQRQAPWTNPLWIRVSWIIVFFCAMALLMTSGARTAIVGFGLAAPLMLFLLWGKKAALTGLIVFVALIPVAWSTGFHRTFVQNCIFLSEIRPTGEDPSEVNPQLSGPGQVADSTDADLLTLEGSLTLESELPLPAGSTLAAGTTLEAGSKLPFASTPTDTDLLTLDTRLTLESELPLPAGSTLAAGTTLEAGSKLPFSSTPAEEPLLAERSLFGGFNVPSRFFNLTGRTEVWDQGFDLYKSSPAIGYGFNADRVLLDAHMHNSYLQALVQTGLLGTIPFVAALLLAWGLLFRVIRKLNSLPAIHKQMVILTAGMLVFFSVRSITESSAAFFGIDLLLLCPLLLYLPVANSIVSTPPGTL